VTTEILISSKDLEEEASRLVGVAQIWEFTPVNYGYRQAMRKDASLSFWKFDSRQLYSLCSSLKSSL